MRHATLSILSTIILASGGCSGQTGGNTLPPPVAREDGKAIGTSLGNETKTISDAIFGYNTQCIKGPGWDKSGFLSKIHELNPGNFRYPGGTVGNFWDWRTGYFNKTGVEANVISPAQDGPKPYKLEDVKKVHDKTGTEPVYMLNVLTSSLEEQLAMLRHAKEIGLPVNYIEMGNEYYLDDHPTKYNYLIDFPGTTDYSDTCRTWTQAIRKEFPDARISMVGVCTPSAWKRPRANAWNKVMMANMTGIECDAFTIHAYPKANKEDLSPEDMLGVSLNGVRRSKILDASIDSKYSLWVTEYNYESSSNPYPGQWVHGLAAALMSAELILTPRVELVCFFNLTAGKPASAIFDADVTLTGEDGGKETAAKYNLSATGEALRMLSLAQRRSTSVTSVSFKQNPQFKTWQNGSFDTLYGYVFSGEGTSKALLINVGDKERTISLDGLGFKARKFEQVSATSLKTAVSSPSSLQRTKRDAGKTVALKAYSITVID